jgi:putative transposase
MVFPIVKLLLVAAGAAGVATLIAIDHAKRERGSEGGATRPSDPATRRQSDDPDFEYLIVDSTIVRAHQHAAGAKKGGLKIRRSVARAAA